MRSEVFSGLGWAGRFVFRALFRVLVVDGTLFDVGLAHFQCCQNALSMLLKVTVSCLLSALGES